jgi:rsbT co-antagonist protein RsbR
MAGSTGGPAPSERLRDLEAMLDAITEYAIIKLDVDGDIARWSPGAEAVTGYSADEVIGKPVSIFYTDEDRRSGLVERELSAAREQGRVELEGWRVNKDGDRFWANVVLAPISDADGTMTGFVKVTRDVSDRRQAEAMFAGLLESAPDAMLIVGPEGRIQLVNRQAEVMFGYDRDELIGREVEVLVPERFRDRHPSYREGFLANHQARPMGLGLDLFALRRDGTELPVEISLGPLQTDRGLLVAAAIRDVTERREEQLRLRRQRDEILELSTPVIRVWDRVLALPIIGTLDSDRASRLTESLLEQIAAEQAEVVILDISGVPAIDTLMAQHLLKTVQAATLMGATSIMSGVRPETAQAIVRLGIDLGQLRSRNTLRDALQLALQILRERAGAPEGATATLGADDPR